MQYKLAGGGGFNRKLCPMSAMKLPPHFPTAPTNPRATIAIENNAIYSLGTQ